MRPINTKETEMTNKEYPAKTIWFDIFMMLITGGLWLIWLLMRYLRTH